MPAHSNETIVTETGRKCRVVGVQLADGSSLPAELVIVGIGIVPEVTPLLRAGAEGGNGVAVDEFCRTSLADVFAIGDCALHANSFADGKSIRLESVQNANYMAATVAKMIMGESEPYRVMPWFWSNQYDLRLQTVGLSIDHDKTVLRGNPEDRSLSLLYLKGGRVVALDCVNATRDYVPGRSLVIGGNTYPPDKLADATLALKDIGAC